MLRDEYDETYNKDTRMTSHNNSIITLQVRLLNDVFNNNSHDKTIEEMDRLDLKPEIEKRVCSLLGYNKPRQKRLF